MCHGEKQCLARYSYPSGQQGEQLNPSPPDTAALVVYRITRFHDGGAFK
jgi:hypothetical protein